MTIQERVVDVRRHTKGFKISGKMYTRKEAVQLARKNKIDGVRVINSRAYGPHLVGTQKSLYDLPIRFEN